MLFIRICIFLTNNFFLFYFLFFLRIICRYRCRCQRKNRNFMLQILILKRKENIIRRFFYFPKIYLIYTYIEKVELTQKKAVRMYYN